MPQRKDILALCLLAGITFIFFLPVFINNLTFGYGDIHRYFYPLRNFSANCIKDGIFPLWNPYLFTGYPNLASLQTGVLYPLSIFTYIFPFFIGFKIQIVFHFFLASSFTYLLMRSWKLSCTSSLISGLTYGFGGYLLSVTDMLTTLSSAVWTPLIFLFFTRAIEHHRKIFIFLTGIALSIQFLGGEPTVLYSNLMVLLMLSIFVSVANFNIRPFVLLFLITLFGLSLVLFQVLPFAEMVTLSSRSNGLTYSHVINMALSPHELLNLFIPFFSGNFTQKGLLFFGQTWLDSIYLGILPIFLAIWAIFNVRRNLNVIFWTIILIGSVLFCFGDLLPTYSFCYKFLPGFNMIRYPIKFFLFASFSIALLAGFGSEHLIRTVEKKKSKYPFILLLILTSIYIIIYGLGIFKEDSIISFVKDTYFSSYTLQVITEWYKQLLNNVLLISLFLIATTLVFYFIKKRLITVNILSFCLVAILLCDLFISGNKINPLLPQSLYTNKPKTLKFIQQDTSCYRIILDSETERFYHIIRGSTLEDALLNVQRGLVPNFGVFHGLFDAGGYESLMLNDYTRFLKETEKSPQLLNLINVKYIISVKPLKREGLKLLFNWHGNRIYANLHFLPRAFLVPNVIVIKDRDKILTRLSSRGFDPYKEIILDEFPISKIKFQCSNIKLQQTDVTIVQYQPNKVVINTSCNNNAFLFLSDNYYPGWKAYIDGQKTEIYRANWTFRAISVPNGKHKIEFIYSPLSFKIGIIISILIIIGLPVAIRIFR